MSNDDQGDGCLFWIMLIGVIMNTIWAVDHASQIQKLNQMHGIEEVQQDE